MSWIHGIHLHHSRFYLYLKQEAEKFSIYRNPWSTIFQPLNANWPLCRLYFYFLMKHVWANSGFFENRIPIKPVLGVEGWGGELYHKLHTSYIWRDLMKPRLRLSSFCMFFVSEGNISDFSSHEVSGFKFNNAAIHNSTPMYIWYKSLALSLHTYIHTYIQSNLNSSMVCLPWLIQTRFWVPMKFFW